MTLPEIGTRLDTVRRCLFALTALVAFVAVGCSTTTNADQPTVSSELAEPRTQQNAAPISDEPAACGPFDIEVEIVPIANTAASQQRTGIRLTLGEHASPCTISGHPGVEFIGGFDTEEGEGCGIVQAQEQAMPVLLTSAAGAHAIITFLDSPGDTPPDYVRVELPQWGFGTSFRWELGTVLCQNAATHPGTFVGAIQPGPVPTG